MALTPIATDFKSTAASAATLAFTAFNPSVGELLVIKVIGENGAGTAPAVPSGGPTFTAATPIENVAGQCFVAVYTATVVSAGSITITVNAPTIPVATPDPHWSCQLERWPVGATKGAVRATVTGSGAPSTTITTTGSADAVSWCNGDFAAVDPAGHTYNTTSATPTEENVDDQHVAGAYVAYYAYQQTTGAGSQTLGITAPNTQTWCIQGVEIIAPPATGGQFPAQPGPTWKRWWRRRQTLPGAAPPAAPLVSTVVSWIRQRRGQPPAQPKGRYWAPVPTGQTNAPRASWVQGRGRATPNKAGRLWAPVPTGRTNTPVAGWIRQRRGSTPTGRGRFWGPPPAPPVVVPAGVASFMRQRIGKVNQARGRFWAPRSTGQTNAPVPSYYKGRARPTVNKAGHYWAPVPTGQTNAPVPSYYHGRSRVVVNKAGHYWQPVPIPPATVARAVASWMRQRVGFVPQSRGRFWAPRSAGQANVPRASWMRQTPRPVPPVHRGQFWVAPPTPPVPKAAPPSFLSRGVRPTSRPRYGGKFWSRLYPAAATTVSKPVASFLRQRRGRTVSDKGRWWTVYPPPPVITVIPPVTVTGSTTGTVTVTGTTTGTVTSSGSTAATTSVSGSTAPATTATGTTGPTTPIR